MVEDHINPIDISWNVDLLNAYFHPDNVKTIRGIAVSRIQQPDTYGWMLTKSGKYSVKSGFRTESLYPDRWPRMSICGPNIKQLLAFSWKLKCSPKLQHFVWQVLSGTLSVSKNQKARGIECDLQCSICGPEEESINHVIFECLHQHYKPGLYLGFLLHPEYFHHPRFLQVWLSFWRLPKEVDSDCFPWIMWYIWKNRNDKIYQNKNGNSQEILLKAEVEGTLWVEA